MVLVPRRAGTHHADRIPFTQERIELGRSLPRFSLRQRTVRHEFFPVGSGLGLRPPDAGCRRFEGEDLPCSRSHNLGDLLHATPLGGYHEQRAPGVASEHASEAASVEVDRLQHLTPLADAYATLVG